MNGGEQTPGQLWLPGLDLGPGDSLDVSARPGTGSPIRRTDPTLLPSPATVERFWSKVVKTPTCWFYTGAISSKGYTRVYYSRDYVRRTISGHRLALLLSGELGTDDDDPGEHACNETLCVRVDAEHVHVGSYVSNNRYAVAQGRHRGPRPGATDPRGPRGRALAIRAALDGGYDAGRLAAAMAWPAAPATIPLFELPTDPVARG